MTRISSRRLTRLEKLAAPVIAERRRRKAEEAGWLREAACDHATKLVTLILHGDPHIEEPLAIAWRRALSRVAPLPDHLRRALIGTHQPPLPDHLRRWL